MKPEPQEPASYEEEHKTPQSPKPKKPSAPASVPPEQPGRGGPSHKYLQSLIKRIGQERGFRARVEEQIDGGVVDVVLQNDVEKTACEISVTTSPEHEWRNIQKCLKAQFTHIVLLTDEQKKLSNIQQFVQSQTEEPLAKNVHFLLPEAFIAFLDARNAKAASTEKTIREYKVKVKYSPVDQQEQKHKQEAIAKLIVESMRRLK